MRIAIIPIGYADGFKRSLSNGVGTVFIDNQRCPVVGRVCMDMIMVDVSAAPCAVGAAATLIGREGDDELPATQPMGPVAISASRT